MDYVKLYVMIIMYRGDIHLVCLIYYKISLFVSLTVTLSITFKLVTLYTVLMQGMSLVTRVDGLCQQSLLSLC